MDFATKLYLLVGGRSGLRPVIERFYDKIYADPWIGQFFQDVDKSRQARRLEDFLSSGAPGEAAFDGPLPSLAHAHMFITQAMLRRRTELLRAAIIELGHPREVVRLWLRADALWHSAVRKTSVAECRPGHAGKALKVIDEPPRSPVSRAADTEPKTLD